MSLTLNEISRLVDGKLSGRGDIVITGAAIIRDAAPGDITLADSPRLEKQLSTCSAAAVVVPPDFQPLTHPYITVDNVHAAFAAIVECFRPAPRQPNREISSAAQVSAAAEIGPDVYIGPAAVIGDNVRIGAGCAVHAGAVIMAGSRIGENVTIYSNATLYESTVVGDRVIIHAGAVIGAFGFGYHTVGGRHQISAQLGNVEIGNDVEIGAGTTIDRGTYGPTTIGAGTKIDNLVMIAHNCRVGRHNLICAQAALSGSCSTGDYVVLAGGVGLRDHIHIGDRAIVGARSGVMHDVPNGETWIGYPATPERDQWVKQSAWAKLPEMRKEFKKLQSEVKQLADKLADGQRQDAA